MNYHSGLSGISLQSTLLTWFLISLILSTSFIKTESVAFSDHPGKSGDQYIPFSYSIFVMAPFLASIWILWPNNKKKMSDHRMKLFKRNGGNLLKKKLAKRKKCGNALMRIYTAEDMKKATSNYSDKRVMERCSPGTFYRGILTDNENTEVVIVKIKRIPESELEHFVEQLLFLSQPHRNMVKIIGCCLETGFPLLVYELHGDGALNLFDFIHGESHFPWKQRVKAAAGAARGLAYFQSHNSRPRFVHGNISSGNILLNDSFDAKVFASNLIRRDTSSSDQIYCDVYRFGAVLAELLTGNNAITSDNRAMDLLSLIEFDNPCSFLDDQLKNEENAYGVKEVAKLAARCLSLDSDKRPNMKEVEARLTELMNGRR